MSEWISVAERLPMLHTDVLVYRRSFCRMGGYQSIEYVTVGLGEVLVWSNDSLAWKSEVTNWMPLPEPPGVTDTNVCGKEAGNKEARDWLLKRWTEVN